MTERVLACPHLERCAGALQPLIEGPDCPYCSAALDLVGVESVVEGGGTVETATALRCLCGWRFTLNQPAGVVGGGAR